MGKISVPPRDLMEDNPSRKYREIRHKLYVLEAEAESLILGKKRKFSVAYTLIGSITHYQTENVELLEIKDREQLIDITDRFFEVRQYY